MQAFSDQFTIVSNYVLQPIVRCIGLVGNIFCIIVLWKPSKEYQVYGYQLAIMINDICGLIAGTFWSAVTLWTSLMKNGQPDGARKNAFIMWYTARIANLSTSIFLIGVCLLLAITSWDRIWAMYFPVSYQAFALNRRKLMISSISCAMLISCALSFPDYFRQYTVYNATTEFYELKVDEDFTKSIFANLMIYGRQAIRFSTFLAIVIANCFVVIKYRKLGKVVTGQHTVSTYQTAKSEKEKLHHRTFTMLLIAQTTLLIIGQGPESIVYAMIYLDKIEWLKEPYGHVIKDIINFLDIAPYWVNILIFTTMSTGFRRLAKNRLRAVGKVIKKIFKPAETVTAVNVVSLQGSSQK